MIVSEVEKLEVRWRGVELPTLHHMTTASKHGLCTSEGILGIVNYETLLNEYTCNSRILPALDALDEI